MKALRSLSALGLLSALLTVAPANAQSESPDRLFLVSGETLDVRITEVLLDAIRYHRWTNRTGPVYLIPKRDVRMVLYANGEHESFGAEAQSPPAAPAGSDEPTAREELAVTARTAPARPSEPRSDARSESQPDDPFGVLSLGANIPQAGTNVTAFGIAVDLTRATPIAEGVRFGYGYDLIGSFVSVGDELFGTYGAGVRAYADYSLNEKATLYGAVGPMYVFVPSVSGGGTSASAFTGYGVTGARYRLGEKLGVHAEFRGNSGGGLITLGVHRQGPFRNWFSSP